jgi:hypothetical protein
MDFRLTADQAAAADGIERIAARFTTKPTDFHGFALASAALEQELQTGGYFDLATVPELGSVSAAIAVERLARLPCTGEIALSMLVRPQLPENQSGQSRLISWPRPLAVVEGGRPGRFVASARTILLLDGDRVALSRPAAGAAEAVESLFAYPMARLKTRAKAAVLEDRDADSVRKWLRIALAAEASGLLHGAIAATVEHVSVRRQFGRPLGTFQALRHRLAECAVLAGGVRWLALQAASTGDAGHAALAALHAQEAATRVAYDVHQMLGAMGMTLEHPLHLWTYRLKALTSDLGGRGGQVQAVARDCFSEDPRLSRQLG